MDQWDQHSRDGRSIRRLNVTCQAARSCPLFGFSIRSEHFDPSTCHYQRLLVRGAVDPLPILPEKGGRLFRTSKNEVFQRAELQPRSCSELCTSEGVVRGLWRTVNILSISEHVRPVVNPLRADLVAAVAGVKLEWLRAFRPCDSCDGI
jgi:hypothetical protein